uniref:DUF6612 family protein n=1 Tax=Enterocloster aldenensis TaxID=358742 RepID=UPI002E7A5875
MKCMKRLLAIVLGAALLCPMTAYAGQTEEAKALYDQVQEKSNAITDMNAFYDFKINFGGSMIENAGITASDMRLEMNVKMNHLTEPALMRYMAYCRMTDPDGSQMTYSMYYLDGYMYMDMMGQKIKMPMAMGDMMQQSMASANAFEVPTDIVKDMNLWDEGENKVIGFTIDDSRMNEFIQTVLGSTGLTGMMEGTSMSLHNIKGEYVVNPNNDLIKMRLKMDMSMTMDGETITMSMDGDVGIADPGQPVDVPVPNVAEYTDITAAANQ